MSPKEITLRVEHGCLEHLGGRNPTLLDGLLEALDQDLEVVRGVPYGDDRTILVLRRAVHARAADPR